MINNPDILLDKLYLLIDRIVQNTNLSKEKIASNVKKLSDIFNQTEGKTTEYMQNDVLRIAYFVYFYPINVYKCLHLINFYRDFFFGKKVFFDYGAGPLTFYSACALMQLEGERFFAYDNNQDVLYLGKPVIKNISLTLYNNLILSFPEQKVNAIFLGNVLSELEEIKIYQLLGKILKIIDMKDNIILILEPGTKKGFKNINKAKQFLMTRGFNFLNACPTENCPVAENDWCHENLFFPRSPLIEYIEQKTGLNNKFINFTYGLFSTNVKKISVFDDNTFKVVGNLFNRKGEYAVYLCGKMGLQLFSILKKHLNEANIDFKNLHRGDIVNIKNFNKISNFYRLDTKSEVKIIKKFGGSNFS